MSWSQFDATKAHERLLDTIRWRQEKGVARMTYESVANEFFDDGGFAFFHKQDRLGRPIAIVRMRYFPQFRDKEATLTELMQPYACLVMEMVRKIMLDITCNNQYHGDPCPLVSQMAVVIDIGKAPFIPVVWFCIHQVGSLFVNSRLFGYTGCSTREIYYGYHGQSLSRIHGIDLCHELWVDVSRSMANGQVYYQRRSS